jgi:hypothetical protein
MLEGKTFLVDDLHEEIYSIRGDKYVMLLAKNSVARQRRCTSRKCSIGTDTEVYIEDSLNHLLSSSNLVLARKTRFSPAA